MKYIFILLIGTFIFAGCGSARKNSGGNKNQVLQQLITPEFEKLDTSAFEIMHRRITYKDTFMKHGDYIIRQNDTSLHELTNGGELFITDSNDKLIKKILRIVDYNEYTETINQYFNIVKVFYSNGNIKSKGIGSHLGFSIGKEFFFNDKGKLIKVIDHDKGYKVTFDDIFLFCKKNNVPIEYNHNGGNTFIYKGKFKGQPAWSIYPSDLRTFVIDGKKGVLRYAGKRPMPLE